MGVDPSGGVEKCAEANGHDDGKIRVSEEYPGLDDQPPFDVKKIETIRLGVKFETHYKIVKSLGDGKFGKVFQVVENGTGHEFAAKFIRIRKEADRAEVEREVSILTQLRHARIAQIYDAFYTTNNDVVLIMEIVRGGELFDRVADETYILSENAVGMIVCQLCEAIDYIHKQNILHLDIKPENIMCVTQSGNQIKLIDFGLARYFDGTQELKYMAGTPEFAAPEVIKFERLSYHTDMWSIGVITYILLSGYSPFLGDNIGETYCNVEKGVWNFTEEFETVSSEAKDFITKLLVYEPSKRMLPAACLEHPWLAAFRKKAQNDKILEKPCLEGQPIDNQKMRRYNANRRLRKVVIYVKFLIEMNRLRNSLRNRMSENGKKFFEPLLKMGEAKEQKIALVLGSMKSTKEETVQAANNTAEPKVKKTAAKVVTLNENGEPIVKKKKIVKRMTVKDKDVNENDKSAPIVKKKTVKSLKEEGSETTEIGNCEKRAAGLETMKVMNSSMESLKSADSSLSVKKLENDMAKSMTDLRESAPVNKTTANDMKKISLSAEALPEQGAKKKIGVNAANIADGIAIAKEPKLAALPPRPPSSSGSPEKRPPIGNEESASKDNLSNIGSSSEDLARKPPTSHPQTPEKRSLLTIPIENYVGAGGSNNSAIDVSKKKNEKAESSDSTKENRQTGEAAIRKPERQGALKKKVKVGADETLNSTNSTAATTTTVPTPKKNLISERLGKLAAAGQEAAPLKLNVVAAVRPPLVQNDTETIGKDSLQQKTVGGSKLLTLTAEKKTTTTTATHTKTLQKVSSTEKKVQHVAEDKKVEAVEKKSSVHDKARVSQTTTTKVEEPEKKGGKAEDTAVKKLTVTEDSIKTRLEKTRAEALKKPLQTEVVKLQSSVTDSHLQKVQMEEKTKEKGSVLKKVSLMGAKDKSIKVAGEVEAEISPHKLSLKRAELAATQKVTTRAGVGENDKDSSKSKTSKFAFKMSAGDGEKPTSSGADGRLALLSRVPSEEKKKAVHFNETAKERDRLPPIRQTANNAAAPAILNKTYSLLQSPSGLQKMKSESNVPARMGTLHSRLQTIEEGSQPVGFNPRKERKSLAEELLRESSLPPSLGTQDEEFSFENLKANLLRRLSATGQEQNRARSPIRIPSTKSLKDRKQQYERMSAAAEAAACRVSHLV